MIKRVGVFIIVLVVMTFCVRQGVTQDKDEEKSPVKQVKQAADRVQRLQRLLNKAQRAEDYNRARQLKKQLIKAKNKEQAILKRLVKKVKEARKEGRKEKAQKMARILDRAVETCSYTRSLDKLAEEASAANSPMVISEICYWPEKGENEWVELKNISGKAFDASGWMLWDWLGLKFSLPEKLSPVPPDGYVLVVFDGTGKPPTPFNKKGKAVVHTPSGLTGDMLGDRGGHLGLREKEGWIRSYVAWGLSPGVVLSEALDSKCWYKGGDGWKFTKADLIVEGSNEDRCSYTKDVIRGGSIYFPPNQNASHAKGNLWRVAYPFEVTPGGDNFQHPRPVPVPSYNIKTREDGKRTVGCAPIKKNGVRYHFQVFTDKGCTELFEEAPNVKPKIPTGDEFPDRVYYELGKPVPEDSVVYWRVRAIYPDGGKSEWTKPFKIRRGKPYEYE